jgi:acyl-CoA synthetase (AMP-forming)/AMP-acid ligase II
MKGVALKICDDGCLEVQSAAVARSYDGASESLSGGVFRTTDLARLRNDTVYLEGRLTDTIHIAGRKVSPQVIEAALLRCPGVRYCVVFGVASSDATRVEEIVACVNMDEGMSHEALQTEIGKMLPSWQVPRRWWKTSQVLPDERGKLPRALWRERFLGVTVH